MKRWIYPVLALIIGALAFWAGTAFQAAHYYDLCLDLGGGRNPGGHPICVLESAGEAP